MAKPKFCYIYPKNMFLLSTGHVWYSTRTEQNFSLFCHTQQQHNRKQFNFQYKHI